MLVAFPPFEIAVCVGAGAGVGAAGLDELAVIGSAGAGSDLWMKPMVASSPIAATIPAPMKRSVF